MHTIRMSRGHVAAILGLVLPVSAVALMMITANVVVNGSFESSAVSLTGWSFAPGTASTATGNCSYNSAVAPGTETVTGVAGFPATDGNNIALGSSHQTTVGDFSCTLYQDVAIPAGATTATFSYDAGIIYDGISFINAAIFSGLYPTTSVPSYTSIPLVGSSIFLEPFTSSTALVHQSVTINVSSLAGTTVRLALINASDTDTGTASVVAFDNVQLEVTSPAPVPTAVPTPTLSEWGMIGLGGLLMIYGWRRLLPGGDGSRAS
jgi:hypothetical protein